MKENQTSFITQLTSGLFRPYLDTYLELCGKRQELYKTENQAHELRLSSAAFLVLFAGIEALANMLMIMSYLAGKMELKQAAEVFRKSESPGSLVCSLSLDDKIKWLARNGCDWESITELRQLRNAVAHNFHARAGYSFGLENDEFTIVVKGIEFGYMGDPYYPAPSAYQLCNQLISEAKKFLEILNISNVIDRLNERIEHIPDLEVLERNRILNLLNDLNQQPESDMKAAEHLHRLTKDRLGNRLEKIIYEP